MQGKDFLQYAMLYAKYFDVLIDSGAFSAYSLGKPIDLNTYIMYCREYYSKCWQYIMLDEVKNVKQSMKNLDSMLSAGLKPMPVLVDGMEYSLMKDFVKINEYICVAGGVGTSDKRAHYRYQQAFKYSEGKAKIHALGFLRFPDIFQLPIYSGDSSSYTAGMRFGIMSEFEPKKGLVTRCKALGNVNSTSAKSVWASLSEETRSYFIRSGVDFIKEASNGNLARNMFSAVGVLNIQSSIKYSLYCNNFNKKTFLAVSGLAWLFTIVYTYKHMTVNKPLNYTEAKKEFFQFNDLYKSNKTLALKEFEHVLYQIKSSV